MDNILTCTKCGLSLLRTQVVRGWPRHALSTPFVVVGEAPGKEEDQQGRPFVGASGKMLVSMLIKAGFQRDQVYMTNVCKCRPPGNRTPTSQEVEACFPYLEEEILSLRPKALVAVGDTACLALTGRPLAENAGSLVNSLWPGIPVLPIYHPAFIMRGNQRLYTVNVWWLRKLLEPPPSCDQNYLINPPAGVALSKLEEWLGSTVAVDIETVGGAEGEGLDPWTDKIVGIAISRAPGEALHLSGRLLEELKPALIEFLKESKLVFHNNLFDRRFIAIHWEPIGCAGDTLLGMHLIEPDLPKSLDFVRTLYTSVGPYKRKYKSRRTGVAHLDAGSLGLYNCLDADVTYRCHLEQKKFVDKQLYERMLREYDLALEMSLRGIAVDLAEVYTRIKELEPKIKDLQQQFIRRFKADPNSPKQLANLLYDKLELPDVGRRKTDEPALKELKTRLIGYAEAHECIDMVLELRRLSKVFNTYLVGTLNTLKPDGFLHPDWIPHGTDTGRWACRNPNVMNFPEDLRPLLSARPGHILYLADYKQLEVRIAALLAEDDEVLEMLDSGHDIHEEVRQAIAKFYPSVTRLQAKTVVFGTFYGRSASSISQAFKVPVDIARKWQEAFYRRFPKLVSFFKRVGETFTRQGYWKTPYGRVKYGSSVTQMFNFPVQSTAADTTIDALLKLKEEGFNILAQVHDAIVVEVPLEQHSDEKFKQFIDTMETASSVFPHYRFRVDGWMNNSFAKKEKEG